MYYDFYFPKEFKINIDIHHIHNHTKFRLYNKFESKLKLNQHGGLNNNNSNHDPWFVADLLIIQSDKINNRVIY